MRRLVPAPLAGALIAAATLVAPPLASADEALFAQRETTGPVVRYAALVNTAYDRLAAGREDQALETLQGADFMALPEAANFALLPQIAYLQARAGQVEQARRTARMARLAVDLETGAARCVDTSLQASGFDGAFGQLAAERYCNAFGAPRTDDLYRRKLAAVEERLR